MLRLFGVSCLLRTAPRLSTPPFFYTILSLEGVHALTGGHTETIIRHLGPLAVRQSNRLRSEPFRGVYCMPGVFISFLELSFVSVRFPSDGLLRV